jgi:hypothetical protein
MELKLFYNPTWMPTEEDISLWCFEIPEQVVIKSFEHFELQLATYYKKLAKKAFLEHGDKIYKEYHEYIDENYWYSDPDTLIDCLMLSNKYYQQVQILEDRIRGNQLPDWILGSDEANGIYKSMTLFELFYLFHGLSD